MEYVKYCSLTLLHSEQSKLYGVLAVLSAKGLKIGMNCIMAGVDQIFDVSKMMLVGTILMNCIMAGVDQISDVSLKDGACGNHINIVR